jgi:hypothetical protein
MLNGLAGKVIHLAELGRARDQDELVVAITAWRWPSRRALPLSRVVTSPQR